MSAVGVAPVVTQLNRRTSRPGLAVEVQLVDQTRIAGTLLGWDGRTIAVRRARDHHRWDIPLDLVVAVTELI